MRTKLCRNPSTVLFSLLKSSQLDSKERTHLAKCPKFYSSVACQVNWLYFSLKVQNLAHATGFFSFGRWAAMFSLTFHLNWKKFMHILYSWFLAYPYSFCNSNQTSLASWNLIAFCRVSSVIEFVSSFIAVMFVFCKNSRSSACFSCWAAVASVSRFSGFTKVPSTTSKIAPS